jgi:hypothetical protein
MPWQSFPVEWPVMAMKHKRIAYDRARQRIVWGMGDGDGSSSGCPRVRAFVPRVAHSGVLLKDLCVPYPDYMPAWPDNVVFDYVPRLDSIILERGFFFGTYAAQNACGRSDANVLHSGMLLGLDNNQWRPPTWAVNPVGAGTDQNGPHWGTYDPTSDKLIFGMVDGWGAIICMLTLGTGQWQRCRLGDMDENQSSSGWRLRNCGTTLKLNQPALDEVGRAVYWTVARTGPFVLKFNIETGTGELVGEPMPAGWQLQASDADKYCVFEPVRRRLVAFHTPPALKYNAPVDHVYLCDVDHGYTWTEDPVPTLSPEIIRGNLWCYYPPGNCIVGMGGNSSPAPTRYFTYTLPDDGGGIPPEPPPQTFSRRVRVTPIVSTPVPESTAVGPWAFTVTPIDPVGYDRAYEIPPLAEPRPHHEPTELPKRMEGPLMPKSVRVTLPTQGLETPIPEGQWQFSQSSVTPGTAATVAYSDTPEYVWTGLVPGSYRFTGVRVSADKSQEIGAKFSADAEVKADVIVQVAAGIDVVVLAMPTSRF